MIPRTDGITRSLIGLNIAFYLYNLYLNGLDALTGLTGKEVIKAGGVEKGGALWDYLTTTFTHTSFVHLLTTIASLVFVGSMVNRTYGPIAYLSTYLGTGLIGSAVSNFINPDLMTTGATAASFGLIGMLVFGMFKRVIPGGIITTALIIAGINFGYTFISSHIDMLSSLTGLTSGTIVGMVINASIQNTIRD